MNSIRMAIRKLSSSLKRNPAQEAIHNSQGGHKGTDSIVPFSRSYDILEVVGRGVDLIVDCADGIDYDLGQFSEEIKTSGNISNTLKFRKYVDIYESNIKSTEKRLGSVPFSAVKEIRPAKLFKLLNLKPNPYEDISTFRRQVFMDLVLNGNAYIHYDGSSLYHLPAENVTVITDKKVKVKHYLYEGDTKPIPRDSVIHIKDNATDQVFIGRSRLRRARNSIKSLKAMIEFQQNFFDNGTVNGLILESEHILGRRMKRDMKEAWKREYNPKSGAKNPVILDGGLKANQISNHTFRELDFELSIENNEKKILKALGVPPTLLDAGNNANISPNMRLFYELTIIPLVKKLSKAISFYFGYDIETDTSSVRSLQPALKEQAGQITTLVNNGLITPNEGRAELRHPTVDDEQMNKFREPKNITGSATDPSEGGRPENESEEDTDEEVNEETDE